MNQKFGDKLYELSQTYDKLAEQARKGGGADPPLTQSQAMDLLAEVLRELWIACD